MHMLRTEQSKDQANQHLRHLSHGSAAEVPYFVNDHVQPSEYQAPDSAFAQNNDRGAERLMPGAGVRVGDRFNNSFGKNAKSLHSTEEAFNKVRGHPAKSCPAKRQTKAAGQLGFDGAPDKDRILQSITDFQGNQKRQFVNGPVGYLKS